MAPTWPATGRQERWRAFLSRNEAVNTHRLGRQGSGVGLRFEEFITPQNYRGLTSSSKRSSAHETHIQERVPFLFFFRGRQLHALHAKETPTKISHPLCTPRPTPLRPACARVTPAPGSALRSDNLAPSELSSLVAWHGGESEQAAAVEQPLEKPAAAAWGVGGGVRRRPSRGCLRRGCWKGFRRRWGARSALRAQDAGGGNVFDGGSILGSRGERTRRNEHTHGERDETLRNTGKFMLRHSLLAHLDDTRTVEGVRRGGARLDGMQGATPGSSTIYDTPAPTACHTGRL